MPDAATSRPHAKPLGAWITAAFGCLFWLFLLFVASRFFEPQLPPLDVLIPLLAMLGLTIFLGWLLGRRRLRFWLAFPLITLSTVVSVVVTLYCVGVVYADV